MSGHIGFLVSYFTHKYSGSPFTFRVSLVRISLILFVFQIVGRIVALSGADYWGIIMEVYFLFDKPITFS